MENKIKRSLKKIKLLSVEMPTDFHQIIKISAIKSHLSISKYVRQALLEKMERDKIIKKDL